MDNNYYSLNGPEKNVWIGKWEEPVYAPVKSRISEILLV